MSDLTDARPSDMPTGTVAFLLTDVEESTASWEAESEAMSAAMERHNAIIDLAVANRGGVCRPALGEGESVVAAFGRPSDAVLAAHDAQVALLAERWPTSRPLRVRMAVHVEEARLLDDGNYAGPAFIRAARLRGMALGGQVLVSASARDLSVDHVVIS
jgi:class 3 adenylate cyclase